LLAKVLEKLFKKLILKRLVFFLRPKIVKLFNNIDMTIASGEVFAVCVHRQCNVVKKFPKNMEVPAPPAPLAPTRDPGDDVRAPTRVLVAGIVLP